MVLFSAQSLAEGRRYFDASPLDVAGDGVSVTFRAARERDFLASSVVSASFRAYCLGVLGGLLLRLKQLRNAFLCLRIALVEHLVAQVMASAAGFRSPASHYLSRSFPLAGLGSHVADFVHSVCFKPLGKIEFCLHCMISLKGY